MYFKKIFSLIIALIFISIITIPVYADTSNGGSENGGGGSGGSRDDVQTVPQLYRAISYETERLSKGEIDVFDYQNNVTDINNNFYLNNVLSGSDDISDAMKKYYDKVNDFTTDVAKSVVQYGVDSAKYIADLWDEICRNFNVPTKTTQISKEKYPSGGGAGYIKTNSDGSLNKYYCDYIVISSDRKTFTLYSNEGTKTFTIYANEGNGWYETYSALGVDDQGYSIRFFNEQGKYGPVQFFGDVRYDDGSQAPTDDVYDTITENDIDNVPDKDIIDMLNDLFDKIKADFPDLSSIEGLLSAILARMSKLDSDNDANLLSAINSSILSLIQADKDKAAQDKETNEELVNTLLDIRDSLKNGTLGTSPEAHGHEISGTVYNVIPLDKNFLNKLFHDKTNLKVQYEGTTYYLEDCGCLKLDDKYYNIDVNYDSYAFSDYDFSNNNIVIDENKYINVDFSNYNTLISSFSSSQKKKIDNVVDLIYKMVSQAVPYGVITSSFAPYEGIIFNTSNPQDIVLNFESTDMFGGFSATILSVSFFQNQYVAAAMNIVKPFLTVIIGYAWLKVMRRKAVGMLR